MRARRYLPFLILTAFACRPADTTASAKQAIDAANAQWPRLTSTGHADSIADFYAEDAVLMPPNMATIRGKDGVRAFFATINTIDPRPTLTLRAETVVASGPVAVETGRWHWAFPAGGFGQIHRALGAAEREMAHDGRRLEFGSPTSDASTPAGSLATLSHEQQSPAAVLPLRGFVFTEGSPTRSSSSAARPTAAPRAAASPPSARCP